MAQYTTAVLGDKNIRYGILNGQPCLHFRDVCRLLDIRVNMSHQISRLHLERDGGYYLLPEGKNIQRYAYFVSVPVMFKIINNSTMYSTEGAQILQDFCEKTFGIKYELSEADAKHCKVCGRVIPPPKPGKSRRSVYCSDKCQRIFTLQKSQERWAAQKAERTVTAVCPICGKTFEKRSPKHTYCCKQCGNIGNLERLKELRKRPKSAFYNPREVYPEVKEPVWDANFTW